MVKNKLVNITKKKVNNKNMVISSVKSKSKFSKNNRNKSRVQKSKRKFQQRQRGTKNIKRNKLSKRIFSNKSYRLKNKKTKKSKLMKLAMLGGGPEEVDFYTDLSMNLYLKIFNEESLITLYNDIETIIMETLADDRYEKFIDSNIDELITEIHKNIKRKKNLQYISNNLFGAVKRFNPNLTISGFDTSGLNLNINKLKSNDSITEECHKKLFKSLDVISKNKLNEEDAPNNCICLFCEEYSKEDQNNEFLNFSCETGNISTKENYVERNITKNLQNINYSTFSYDDDDSHIKFINIHSASQASQEDLVPQILKLLNFEKDPNHNPKIDTKSEIVHKFKTIIGGDSNVYYNLFKTDDEQKTANPMNEIDIKKRTYVPIIKLMEAFEDNGYNVLISKNIVFKTRSDNLFYNAQCMYKSGGEPVETMFIAYPKDMEIKYDKNLYFNSKDLKTIIQLEEYTAEKIKMETELDEKNRQPTVEDKNIPIIDELGDLIKLRTILNPGNLHAFKGFDDTIDLDNIDDEFIKNKYNVIFGLDKPVKQNEVKVGGLMSDHVPIYMDITVNGQKSRVIYSNNVSIHHKTKGIAEPDPNLLELQTPELKAEYKTKLETISKSIRKKVHLHLKTELKKYNKNCATELETLGQKELCSKSLPFSCIGNNTYITWPKALLNIQPSEPDTVIGHKQPIGEKEGEKITIKDVHDYLTKVQKNNPKFEVKSLDLGGGDQKKILDYINRDKNQKLPIDKTSKKLIENKEKAIDGICEFEIINNEVIQGPFATGGTEEERKESIKTINDYLLLDERSEKQIQTNPIYEIRKCNYLKPQAETFLTYKSIENSIKTYNNLNNHSVLTKSRVSTLRRITRVNNTFRRRPLIKNSIMDIVYCVGTKDGHLFIKSGNKDSYEISNDTLDKIKIYELGQNKPPKTSTVDNNKFFGYTLLNIGVKSKIKTQTPKVDLTDEQKLGKFQDDINKIDFQIDKFIQEGIIQQRYINIFLGGSFRFINANDKKKNLTHILELEEKNKAEKTKIEFKEITENGKARADLWFRTIKINSLLKYKGMTIDFQKIDQTGTKLIPDDSKYNIQLIDILIKRLQNIFETHTTPILPDVTVNLIFGSNK